MTIDELEKRCNDTIAEIDATYDYPENHTVELSLTLKLIAVTRAVQSYGHPYPERVLEALAELEDIR